MVPEPWSSRPGVRAKVLHKDLHCSTAVDFFVKVLHPDPNAGMIMAQLFEAPLPYMACAMQELTTGYAHAISKLSRRVT